MQKYLQHTDDFLNDEDYTDFVRGNSINQSRKWNEYLSRYPETKPEAENARKIISGLYSMKDNLSSQELNEYQLQRNFEDTWMNYRDTKTKSAYEKASKFIRQSIAVAAIIVFAVTFYSLLNNFILNRNSNIEFFEIDVPAAKQSRLTLPDGTKVWMNSETKVRYSNRFNNNQRDVFLNGEAYFEVACNKNIPFNVFANGVQVKVLGTKFNVKAYPDENVETVLKEGKVNLGLEASGKRSVELTPGDKAVFDAKTNKVTISRKDVDIDLAWKDGKMIFRNTPLITVCKNLERWYGAEIELAGDAAELRSHPFTFTVENESLSLVLENLCEAAQLKFRTNYIDDDGEKGIEKTKYIIGIKH